MVIMWMGHLVIDLSFKSIFLNPVINMQVIFYHLFLTNVLFSFCTTCILHNMEAGE